MIHIHFNNQPMSINQPITIAQWLSDNKYSPESTAIAINQAVIPKKEYTHTMIQEGDHLDLIMATPGG